MQFHYYYVVVVVLVFRAVVSFAGLAATDGIFVIAVVVIVGWLQLLFDFAAKRWICQAEGVP